MDSDSLYGLGSFDLSHERHTFYEDDFLKKSFSVKSQDSILIKALDFLNLDKLDTAISMTKHYIDKNPTSAVAYEILGAGLAKKGNLEEGLSALQKAVKINPNQGSALTKIGDIFLAKNEYTVAKEYFLKALKCTPDDRRAHQRLGIIYESEKDFQSAVSHYEMGLYGIDPEYVGIKINLANLYNSLGKYDKTLLLLERLVTKDTKNTFGHLTLGAAYLGKQKYEKAINEFKIACEHAPKEPRAAYLLGLSYRFSGDLVNSEKKLLDAITIDPKSFLPYFQLAETFKAGEKFDKALEYYEKLKGFNQILIAQKGIADVYLKQKNIPKAISIYEELIQSKNSDIETYDLLITALQLDNQLDKAEKRALEMCTRFPKDSFSFYRLGIFYSYATKYSEAHTQLKKALSLSPNDILILKALSLTSNRLGKSTDAIDYARTIVKIDPNNVDNLFYLGALLQDNNDQDAIEIYRKILSQKPDYKYALNNLALLMLDKGSINEAIKYSERAAKLDDQNGNILDTYGWILFKNNDMKKSLPVLQKAKSLLPKNPSILYHLATVYNQLGKKSEAKQSLEQLSTLKSNFKYRADANALLEQLNNNH
jgi:tetratricopeptide (TPR) repeat protein